MMKLVNPKIQGRGAILTVLIISVLSLTVLFLSGFSYKREINKFKDNLYKGKYEIAYDSYLKVAKKSKKRLEEANKIVFSYLEENKDSYLSKKTDEAEAVKIMDELKRYPAAAEEANSAEKLISEVSQSRGHYNKSKELFNSGDYENAIKEIDEMSVKDPDATEGEKLRDSIFSDFKSTIFLSAEESYDTRDFVKAIQKLESKSEYFKDDMEFVEKLNFYKNEKLKADKLIEEERKRKEEEARKRAEEEKRKKDEALKAVISAPFDKNGVQEKYINLLNLSSSTKYLVWVNLQNQVTYVFDGSKNNWSLIQAFSSSTGKKGSSTPRGTFKINGRGTWFFSNKYQQGGMYWVRFLGDYLFHSLPMDTNQNVVDTTLGVAASHGCVRLSIENSKWIYNNLSNGTTVLVK